MTTQVRQPQTNGVMPVQSSATRKPTKNSNATSKQRTPNPVARAGSQKPLPVQRKAASVAGETPVNGVSSAYAIMATRLANRVAELAEGITFVERSKPKELEPIPERKKPRKLEMRLESSAPDQVAFSAPFLDNLLQKMLQLQNRMLKSTAELSKAGKIEERVIKEYAAQSAELSRVIALICAEKARQGA